MINIKKIVTGGRDFPFVPTVCLMLVLAIAAGGCSTLKKKFTRQKKKGAQEEESFVPVLVPEEYPTKVETPEMTYKHHYFLWQVWEKEFLTALTEESSPKRLRYMLAQLIVQAEGMAQVLNEEKRIGLSKALKNLQDAHEELERPEATRNESAIRGKVNAASKIIRKDYKVTAVQGSFVQ